MGGLPQPKFKSYRKVPVVKKVMLIFLKKVTLINRTEILKIDKYRYDLLVFLTKLQRQINRDMKMFFNIW